MLICMLTFNLNHSHNHSHHPSLQGKNTGLKDLYTDIYCLQSYDSLLARKFIKRVILKERLHEVTLKRQRLTVD